MGFVMVAKKYLKLTIECCVNNSFRWTPCLMDTNKQRCLLSLTHQVE